MEKFSQCFEVYGFTIEVHAGGRRVWPPIFKQFIKRELESCELIVDDVMKACNVCQSLVYKWRSDVKRASSRQTTKHEERMFSEVVFEDVEQHVAVEADVSQITLRGRKTEILLPPSYPVDALVKVVLALEGQV